MTTTSLQYCGNPISAYAIRRYGPAFIADRLAQVQYCVHGDRCEECCFIYKGTPWKPYAPHGMQISMSALFRQVVHGQIPKGKYIRTCTSKYCVSPSHCFTWKKYKTSYDVLRLVEYCKHGWLCESCCWPWAGFIHRSTQIPSTNSQTPAIKFSGVKNVFPVPRYLAETILGVPIALRERVLHTCQNQLCVNFWHIEILTRREFIQIARALSPTAIKHKERYAHSNQAPDHQSRHPSQFVA